MTTRKLRRQAFFTGVLAVCGALLLGPLVAPAAPAHAAVESVVIDGTTYRVDPDVPEAGATVAAYNESSGPVVSILGEVEIGGATHPVKTIGEDVFRSKGLTSVDIPENVVTIENEAFGWNNLATLKLPDSLRTIGVQAFRANPALEEVDFGNGVEFIDQYAFTAMNMKHVYLPDSVHTIAKFAFQSEFLESVSLGSGISSIGNLAFSSNTSRAQTLNSIEFRGTQAPTSMVAAEPNGNHLEGSFYTSLGKVVTYPCGASGFTTPLWYGYRTEAECQLTFESNGGTAVEPLSFVAGQPIAKMPAEPTLTGHRFDGWYTDAELTKSFKSKDPVMQSWTLYAKWSPLMMGVYFDTGMGSSVPEKRVPYNQPVPRPDEIPTYEGHSFTGWFADYALTEEYNFSKPVLGYTVLYAGWQINDHTVTFDSRGGTAVEPKNVTYGDAVAKPDAIPVREGHDFTGWFADVDATNPYVFTSPVLGDLTLYAGWKLNEYTVTFDSRGGTEVVHQQAEHGSAVSKPTPDPTREGFVFSGWYADADLTAQYIFETPVTQSKTLYAGWTEPETTIPETENPEENGTPTVQQPQPKPPVATDPTSANADGGLARTGSSLPVALAFTSLLLGASGAVFLARRRRA